MSSHIVYEVVPRAPDDDADRPTMFAGQKLWFAHRVPQRKWLIENARLNGAVVVEMDTDAHVKLDDHARKSHAPGTHSYKYVEASIRNGRLEDLASHAIGVPSRATRPVGSVVTAPKTGRTPFTPEDDQLLWNWIKPLMDRGGPWKGNEIYKQLEAVNPRHTYQSWRDRWDKRTRFQNRQITGAVGSQDPQPERPAPRRKRQRELDDDGEEEQSTRNGPERDASILPRRSLARRSSHLRAYTYEDAKHDARREQGQDTASRGTSRSNRVEAQSSEKPQSDGQSLVPMRSMMPPNNPSHTKPQDHERSNARVPARTFAGGRGLNVSVTNVIEGGPSNVLSSTASNPFTDQEDNALRDLIPLFKGKKRHEWHDYNKGWEDLALDDDSHSAAEWKQRFLSTTLPDYCEENRLQMSEVAPFLFEDQLEGIVRKEHDERGDQGRTGETSETSSQDELSCSICFTSGASKWRQDKEGKINCYECHKLVKQHGYHRASLLVTERRRQIEVEETKGWRQGGGEDSHTAPDSRDLAEQTTTTTPSKLADESKQAAPATVAAGSHSGELAGPSRNAYRASPEGPRRTKSPSFQPQSPTLGRPPTSNISKKRAAGKSSRSQSSTQPSNPSNSNSQNATFSTQSQSQGNVSKDLAAEMGQEQSREDASQATQAQPSSPPTVPNAVPSFQATSKGKRKRLQDEPDTLPTQQDSSLSTDGALPPQRSAHLSSSNSEKGNEHAPAPFTLPTLTTPSGRFETQARSYSPLFVPENEDDYIEEDVADRQLHLADENLVSSPARVELVSDGLELNTDTQPTSEPEYEDTDEDGDTNFGVLVPLNKRQRSEGFETAQETPANFETAQEEQTDSGPIDTQALFDRLNDEDDFDMTDIPDPPGGFEAYGVGPSLVPPDHDYKPTDGLEEKFVVAEQRNESPVIKVEHAGDLESIHEPTNLIEDSSSASTPEVDRPETLLAEQEEARFLKTRRPQEEEEQDQARQHEDNARQEKVQESERSSSGRRQEAKQRDVEPRSTTAIEEPAGGRPTQSSPKPDSNRSLDITDWLAQQQNLHPRTRALDPILWKAAEATGFNFALATNVVETMLSNRDAHMSRLRRLHAVKKTTTEELLALDADLFLPRDVRGVWTKEDDHHLVYTGPEGQNRVAKKHGGDNCAARFEFMQENED